MRAGRPPTRYYRLVVSEGTVEHHVVAIVGKLDSAPAAKRALRLCGSV